MVTDIYPERPRRETPRRPARGYRTHDGVIEKRYYYPNAGHQVVSILLFILEVILILRLVLHLLAADPYNAFVKFIYNVSAPLVAPFQGIFPAVSSNSVTSGSVLEWSTIIAMIIYAIVAFIIEWIIDLVSPRPVS
ncbi:MAG: YggT family protein [Patescibacteria group bacterium]|nr:YggT family protein [Patescibacteria group bacterium]